MHNTNYPNNGIDELKKFDEDRDRKLKEAGLGIPPTAEDDNDALVEQEKEELDDNN